METKTTSTKPNNFARKGQSVVDKASAKLAGVGQAANQTQGRIAKQATKSGHRLQETAQKVRHAARQLATGALHSAQETAQKVVHRAKEVATTAEHRREELTGKPASQSKRP